jgi:hypothetical protein
MTAVRAVGAIVDAVVGRVAGSVVGSVVGRGWPGIGNLRDGAEILAERGATRRGEIQQK